MCLLIALFGVAADAPLIVAANRDELYARPAVTMTTLRSESPRVLGGRDEAAGGTWLAVNSHGVVAGLTNQPSPAGRDATRRSRGELPLAFAACRSASEAVTRVCAALNPADFNPCWLLIGDRDCLFSVGLAGDHRPEIEQLPPGLHVLENAPLRTASAKTAQVARMVTEERAAQARASMVPAENAATGVGRAGDNPVDGAARAGESAAAIGEALAAVLRDHRPAEGVPGAPWPLADGGPPLADGASGAPRPAELSAACVHTPEYGTRSALIVTVKDEGPPLLRVSDGPPCRAPLRDVTGLWARSALV